MSLGKHTRSISELDSIAKAFANELVNAANDQHTCFGFIKHQLSPKNIAKENELVQVMCVGGSNLQVSKFIANQHINPISLAVEKLPILESKKVLFEFLTEFIDINVSTIAVNFAYPMEPKTSYGVIDGKLLTGTKEHLLSDLIGDFVGKEFSEFVAKQLKKDIKVAVANDTVCLTLAGLEVAKRKNLVAMILGTGNNTGLFLDDLTVVNVESGNFDKFELSESGQSIDQDSTNPGKQLLEKEVSGAYVYKHYNFYANQYGIDSTLTSTKEVNDLAMEGLPVQQHIAQHVVRESAKLVAAQIAGFVWYKKAAIDLVIEGGFYRNGYKYDALVNHYLEELDIKSTSVTFHHIENSSILGAAHLVI